LENYKQHKLEHPSHFIKYKDYKSIFQEL
jgi:hypothetical protein